MKRIFVYLLFIAFTGFVKNTSAQSMFWYETFGLGCNQTGLLGAPTPSNGPWMLGTPGANGSQANQWFMSATEAGRPPGACGDGCLNNAGLTNRSIHIGVNLPGPLQDAGAFYAQTANSNTDKRAESPVINCTGRNNITLSFNYFMGGALTDFCDVELSLNNGTTWNLLGTLTTTLCNPTPTSGLWTNQTYTLPPGADGNPNVKVGFRWRNGNTVGPGNISVAIDEVMMLCPSITFTLPPQACVGVPFNPTNVSTVIPTTNYSWTAGPAPATFTGQNLPTPEPGITFTNIGVQTVTIMAMNNGVLTSSATATVNIVNQIQFTTAVNPSTICPGETATLTAFGGTVYTWQPGNLNASPVVVSPTVPTIYTVTGNAPNGCPGIGTVLVNIGAYPNISVVTSATAVCNGFTSTLTATGAQQYTWTGTTLNPPVYQPSVGVGPGTYTVIAAMPPMPCPAYSVITISTAPPLSLTVSHSPITATTCISANFPPNSLPVTLNAAGAGVYYWTPSSSLNYSIGPSVMARPINSTCYTVTGVTSVCSGSAIICVTVIPQYTIDVIPKQPYMCIGDSIKMRIANISSLSIGPYSYNWMEPGNAPPPSLDNPLSPSVTISPTNLAAVVTYSAETVDSRGCASAPKLIPVTVLPRPLTSIAIPTISGVPTNSICYVGSGKGSIQEATIKLEAVNGNGNGIPPGVVPTFTWRPPDSYPPTYTMSAILTPPNEGTVILAAPIRTPDLVTYTIQSGYNGIPGCTRIDTVTLRIVDCRPLSPTSAQFTTAIPNDTICSRTCVTFVNLTDTAAGGPQTYTWTFQGGSPSTSTLQSPTICYNLPGRWNVTLRARSPYELASGGSTATAARMSYIKVVDIPNPKILPVVAVGKDTTIRYGQSITLTATNAATYVWYPNYNLSGTSGSVVTATPRKNTSYIVEGYNSNSCRSRDTINVFVIEDCGEMFVPNAFSPNNDGANDVLYVRGVCLETMTFIVFNKWGQVVFETNDQELGWDGTFKGEPLNTDVFVYRLEGKTHEGKSFSLKGNITLIR